MLQTLDLFLQQYINSKIFCHRNFFRQFLKIALRVIYGIFLGRFQKKTQITYKSFKERSSII